MSKFVIFSVLMIFLFTAGNARAGEVKEFLIQNGLDYPIIIERYSRFSKCYEAIIGPYKSAGKHDDFVANISARGELKLTTRDSNKFFTTCYHHDKILDLRIRFNGNQIPRRSKITPRVRKHIDQHGHELGRIVLKHHRNKSGKWISYGIDETHDIITADAWCGGYKCSEPNKSRKGDVTRVLIDYDRSSESNFSH